MKIELDETELHEFLIKYMPVDVSGYAIRRIEMKSYPTHHVTFTLERKEVPHE